MVIRKKWVQAETVSYTHLDVYKRQAQGREEDWIELKADDDAIYDEEITIALDEIEPLVACPHSPDNIKKVSEIKDLAVDQVAICLLYTSCYDLGKF